MRFADTVTITVSRPTRDAFGDVTTAVRHTVADCAVIRRASTEQGDRRESVTRDLGVLVPGDADIRATDIVTVPGEGAFQVLGAPVSWRSPLTGWDPGVLVTLRQVTG